VGGWGEAVAHLGVHSVAVGEGDGHPLLIDVILKPIMELLVSVEGFHGGGTGVELGWLSRVQTGSSWGQGGVPMAVILGDFLWNL